MTQTPVRPRSQARPSARPGTPMQPPRNVLPRIGNPGPRQRVLTLLLVLLMMVFAVRLVIIQGFRSNELSEVALQERLVTRTIPVERADILDRNGQVLATSVDRYHVAVNQTEIATFKRVSNGQVLAEGPIGAAEILAPILDVPASELAAELMGEKKFHYIAKNVSQETWDLISAERIKGISSEKTSERLYPNGAVGGNIVGFMGGREDRQGLWGLAGIESSYESVLMGTPGTRTYERGGGGTIIPTGVLEETPAVPGQDVVTTIDRDFQWAIQNMADDAMANTGSSQVTVVVLDTQTNEVLAMVDSNSVDPSNPGASAVGDRGSRAVSSVFEPGSTAKIITVAAAMEEGLVTPESQFIAPYRYTTSNNETFHDSHEHADQKLTTTGVLATSSNTGTVQIGQLMDEATRYEYLSKFGFGTSTNAGLPGESAGILHPYKKWDGRTKYAVLYGQGVSVTALQVAQVYSTIANGGLKQSPTLVKGFQDQDGVLHEREREEPERVISEQTAKDVLLMMEQVVDGGTGRNALIDGYRVAGKTGTAQAADSTGALKSIVASFVGIAPADNPRVVVAVIMHDPKTAIWGSVVAAPLFKEVTEYVLQSLRVPPSEPRTEAFATTWE